MPCIHTYTLLRDGVVLATAKEYGRVLSVLQADAQKHVCPCDFELLTVEVENNLLTVTLAAPPNGSPVRAEVVVTTDDDSWEFNTINFAPIDVSAVTGTWETVTVTMFDADDLACGEQTWTFEPEPAPRVAMLPQVTFNKLSGEYTFDTTGSVGNYVRIKFYAAGHIEVPALGLADTLNTGTVTHTVLVADLWNANLQTIEVEISGTIGGVAQATHVAAVKDFQGKSNATASTFYTPTAILPGETLYQLSTVNAAINGLTGEVITGAKAGSTLNEIIYTVSQSGNVFKLMRYRTQTTEMMLYDRNLATAGCNADRMQVIFTIGVDSPASNFDPVPIEGDRLYFVAEYSTDLGATWSPCGNPTYNIIPTVGLAGLAFTPTYILFGAFTVGAQDEFQFEINYDNIGCGGGIITRLTVSIYDDWINSEGMGNAPSKAFTKTYVP